MSFTPTKGKLGCREIVDIDQDCNRNGSSWQTNVVVVTATSLILPFFLHFVVESIRFNLI